jgi:DNA topoisomerase-3
MESAGKTVDDEALREAMKENGIGRPSTRANIIETLFKRHYIYRKKKNIMASQAGIDLIATINEELLKSAKLTGIWENRLRRIEHGDYSPAEFINELKEQITRIVHDVLTDSSQRRIDTGSAPAGDGAASPAGLPVKDGPAAGGATAKPKAPRKPPIKKLEQIVCPVCGKGHILKGNTAYGCSEFRNGCTLRLPFADFPADLTPAKLNTQLKKQFKKK